MGTCMMPCTGAALVFKAFPWTTSLDKTNPHSPSRKTPNINCEATGEGAAEMTEL